MAEMYQNRKATKMLINWLADEKRPPFSDLVRRSMVTTGVSDRTLKNILQKIYPMFVIEGEILVLAKTGEEVFDAGIKEVGA
jgi:hypothetical protein